MEGKFDDLGTYELTVIRGLTVLMMMVAAFVVTVGRMIMAEGLVGEGRVGGDCFKLAWWVIKAMVMAVMFVMMDCGSGYSGSIVGIDSDEKVDIRGINDCPLWR